MKRDIDFKDLIKIVSDIENKYQHQTNTNTKIEYKRRTLEEIFNTEENLIDKLNSLKVYEQEFSNNDPAALKKLFYEEAKCLENISLYEDYYNSFYTTAGVLSPMDSYMSYKRLTILELKRYLTWRTKLRKGIFTYANSKFIYIYVNEIYRGIGIKNKEEGFDILMYLFENLYYLSPRNENIFRDIVLEYVYINNIDIEKSYSFEMFSKFFINNKLSKRITLKTYKEIANFYYENTPKNNILEQYEKTYRRLLEKIFENIDLYLKQHNSNLTDMICTYSINEYKYFYKNMFLEKYDISEKKINVEDIYVIDFKKEKYLITEVIETNKYDNLAKYICHRLEFLIREHYNERSIKQKLYPIKSVPNNNFESIMYSDFMKGLIDTVILSELKKEKVDNSIKIDLSKLENIRTISNEVSSKLITEFDVEEEPIEEKKVEIVQTDNVWLDLVNQFDKIEKEILYIQLTTENRTDIKNICTKNNKLLEVIIESINEKSMELIEDNLVELQEEDIYIYDEYIEELKNVLLEVSND